MTDYTTGTYYAVWGDALSCSDRTHLSDHVLSRYTTIPHTHPAWLIVFREDTYPQHAFEHRPSDVETFDQAAVDEMLHALAFERVSDWSQRPDAPNGYRCDLKLKAGLIVRKDGRVVGAMHAREVHAFLRDREGCATQAEYERRGYTTEPVDFP